jgi:hypothetical protein
VALRATARRRHHGIRSSHARPLYRASRNTTSLAPCHKAASAKFHMIDEVPANAHDLPGKIGDQAQIEMPVCNQIIPEWGHCWHQPSYVTTTRTFMAAGAGAGITSTSGKLGKGFGHFPLSMSARRAKRSARIRRRASEQEAQLSFANARSIASGFPTS